MVLIHSHAATPLAEAIAERLKLAGIDCSLDPDESLEGHGSRGLRLSSKPGEELERANAIIVRTIEAQR